MKRLVVGALLAGLVAVPSPVNAVDADRTTWRELHVPYIKTRDLGAGIKANLVFDGMRISFESNFRTGIFSMAVNADAVVAMKGPQFHEGEDIEGALAQTGAGGGFRIDRRALGIPLADVNGHAVFWTKRVKRRAQLMVFDTESGVTARGPLVHRDARVFAVEGETAYVMDFFSDDRPATALRWTLGEPTAVAVPLPPAEDEDESRLIIDVQDGNVLSAGFDDDEAVWSDPAGHVLGTAFATFGALSPSGQHLAFTTERRVKVIDVGTGALVPLQLARKNHTFDYRWTSDGRIVLTGRRGHVGGDYDESARARRYVCTVPDGACELLPGLSFVYYEPMVESSSWGQLVTLLIPIGSRSAVRSATALRRP